MFTEPLLLQHHAGFIDFACSSKLESTLAYARTQRAFDGFTVALPSEVV